MKELEFSQSKSGEVTSEESLLTTEISTLFNNIAAAHKQPQILDSETRFALEKREIDEIESVAKKWGAKPHAFMVSMVEWFEHASMQHVAVPHEIENVAYLLKESLFRSSQGFDGMQDDEGRRRIDMTTRLLLVSRVTQNKILSRHIGKNMVMNYAYDLCAASPQTLRVIVDRIVELSTAEQIDVIHQLTTIGAAAKALGMENSDNGVGNAITLIQSIEQHNDCALIAFVRSASSIAMEKAYKSASPGGWSRENSTQLSRLHTKDVPETFLTLHEALRRQMRTDPPLPRGHHLYPMSPEIVMQLNEASLPVAYTHAAPAELPQMFGVIPESLDDFETFFSNLSHARRLTPRGKVHYFHMFMLEIICPDALGAWDPVENPIDAEEAMAIASTAFPNYSSIWKRLFTEIAPGRGYPDEDLTESPNLTDDWKNFCMVALRKIKDIRGRYTDTRPLKTLQSIETLASDDALKVLIGNATKQEILLLRHLHNPEILFDVQEILHVAIGNMPIVVQIPFVRYLTQQSMSELTSLGKAFEKLNANENDSLLMSFLACREDVGNGDLIVQLVENLPKDQSQVIFDTYAALVKEASNTEQFLRDQFRNDATPDEVRAIANRFVHNANLLLHRFASRIDSASPSERHRNVDEICTLLERYSVKGQVLLQAYRLLKEQQQITDMSEVTGVEYEVIEGRNLVRDPEALEALCALYRKNYPPFTGEELAKRFKENIKKRDAVVHRISFRDKVVAFMLVVPVGEKRVYVSALNVDPELVGAKPGVTLLKKILDLVQEGNVVEAEAIPRLAKQYSEQFGFEKTGEFNDPIDGERLFKLELRPLSQVPASTVLRTRIDAGNKSRDH
ncbi:hypothetical protein A3A38_02015 [Candidatus Kaiserbacteria bacterium RIFCSPLOWO2_01_FULL_53_17]|uniref:N-acetyltransferase domain-containing protein n=1 Tax=Candidatus Kaiserbacteria bacterium RIFCSPLOWO2_01_FULL_53_17 TaxID=1798511 RepID=A0A1F6EGX7_9BACT|nr:MAG: hypothetical protein A3A38_02015 [Candidatus Kaiserbacteria bacterium RIFCSPLOWO2_01_FULL_53_17]